jgi:hypothetical protein
MMGNGEIWVRFLVSVSFGEIMEEVLGLAMALAMFFSKTKN